MLNLTLKMAVNFEADKGTQGQGDRVALGTGPANTASLDTRSLLEGAIMVLTQPRAQRVGVMGWPFFQVTVRMTA